ncbi:hypothetical protein [Mucilaginibacter boryungensis]|uniref:Uncharacterized protein n=1 Tax=Mucilaginibacter boryungensis TaxID=768480 RepID=A0ABR9XN37_9SPHI|nr:hypothetical protein [Mucilaginibacter boryungensis]MBE9668625.1 hypothetical protein [Mucilaginibacter boryungensis]
MTNKKLILFIVLSIIPFVALAHGEEALLTLLIIPVSIIIFFIFISIYKASARQKTVLTVVYWLTLLLTFICIDILPYHDNMSLINGCLAFVPFICMLIAGVIYNRLSERN